MPSKTHLDLTGWRTLNQPFRIFHVFADGRDEFTKDIGEALSIAGEYLADGESNVRIYYEDYPDQEAMDNDKGGEEDSLFHYGSYPS